MIAQKWPGHLVNALRKRLREGHPDMRADTAPFAITVLMDSHPSLGLDMVESLIATLRLPDGDPTEGVADIWAVQALAVIYAHHPAEVERILQVIMSSGEEEMQKFCVKVYECIVELAEGKSQRVKTASAATRVKCAALVLVSFRTCIRIACDRHVALRCREAAVWALRHHDRGWSKEFRELLDPLLGAVAQWRLKKQRSQTTKRNLEFLKLTTQINSGRSILRMDCSVIEDVERMHPRLAMDAIRDMLEGLSGDSTHVTVLWAALLELYAEIVSGKRLTTKRPLNCIEVGKFRISLGPCSSGHCNRQSLSLSRKVNSDHYDRHAGVASWRQLYCSPPGCHKGLCRSVDRR